MAHRAVCGRVAEVVADSGHQKVLRESPDMLSGAKKRQGQHRRTVAAEAMLLRWGPNFEQTLYSRACIEENSVHSLVAIRAKIQRCVLI